MAKPTKTIRFGSKFVRLSINPILLNSVQGRVDWKDTVQEAKRRHPKLPLSWAVEGVLLEGLHNQTPEVSGTLPLEIVRFQKLTPGEKIRHVLRWKNTLVRIRGLR